MREKITTKTEEEKNEKLEFLEKIEQEVKESADAMGTSIDPEIKESVIALKLWDFPTYQSCEGHSLEDSGDIEIEQHQSIAPWIWIESEEPENLEKDELAKKEYKKENLRYQLKMLGLLDEFYKEGNTPFDVRLYLESRGIYGAFAITNQGADAVEILSPEEQDNKRLSYQKEMRKFSEFLKEKYFQQE